MVGRAEAGGPRGAAASAIPAPDGMPWTRELATRPAPRARDRRRTLGGSHRDDTGRLI